MRSSCYRSTSRFLVKPSAGGLIAASLCLLTATADANAATPVLRGQTERPLRYLPVDGGFAITNGPDSFNRPLYGGDTAFRVDAGDRPEFSLYLPGRGGVLRVGIATGGQTKWLRDAAKIDARYADAAMSYVVTDPASPGITIRLTAVALRDTEGLILKADIEGATAPVDLLFAYGGLSGQKAKRNGDIGTEAVPMSQYFALQPDHCRDDAVVAGGNIIEVKAKAGTVKGYCSAEATSAVADARLWNNPDALSRSAGSETDRPVALATAHVKPGMATYFALERASADGKSQFSTTQPTSGFVTPDLEGAFSRAAAQNRAVARQVVVETPDPFINSAVAAMCVAADAIKDPSGTFMHGGVAWRQPLLGWRGPYAADATGDHDYARSHLAAYFKKQNQSPIADGPVGADDGENLARSEKWLRSNGDLTDAHYDMNLVAVDMFFRHLLWTGDLEYAKANWPVIQRHLAWEKRLFRRPFGAEGLPLYEAYACIWASDDLQYSGGGVTHASAYNYYHNVMAARVAALIGEDPKPYGAEATLIRRAMQENLWLPQQGWFAENKDLLGRQAVHPDAALWTHYHTIDSHVPDAFQAWQMCRYIDTQIPHIPIHGQGVPGGLFTLTSTDWMPYTWSINNVAMAEVTHTALADWQAGRPEMAFDTWKGAVLDSMFLGQCPGNLHMVSFFDAYRQEAQRDSGDPIGATWRALIEGLFGISPDMLAGELTIDPGFPAEWDRAAITHPNLSMRYRRGGNDDQFTIEPKFAKPMSLKLRVAVRNEKVVKVTVNGKPATWRSMDERVGDPHVEVTAPPAAKWDVVVSCDGDALRTQPVASGIAAIGQPIEIGTAARELLEVKDPQGVLKDVTISGRKLRATVADALPGARTVFLHVRQGDLSWWQPVPIDVRPVYGIQETAFDSNKPKLSFRVANNSKSDLDVKAVVELNGVVKTVQIQSESLAVSGRIVIDAPIILAGQNRLAVTLPGQSPLVTNVSDWLRPAAMATWDAVDLTPYFNDRVTQVFKNRYVSPRSPYCSLAMPVQGYGGWATNKTTPPIDDAGLRAAGGEIQLPGGLPLATPAGADAKNILFTSQWDNYPREATVPLTGRASQAYLMMAGTTNAMQSRFDNGEVVVIYEDGITERLALRNPDTWWPIEQDYFIDDYGFHLDGAMPPRIDLKTGRVRMPGDKPPLTVKPGFGGAATVLSLPLDPKRTLKSLTVRALANEVVIGLMSVTLQRPADVNPKLSSTTKPVGG
ncbi:MAG: hypothetical protein JWM57_1189 [Phycisphaerales bacterium]|nr:hypothetical protein [Phycisphaerales bacterium]